MEFCAENELIRFGGGSKSEILEKCNVARSKRLQASKCAKIIGMTTTGAAKFRTIIDEVRPRIASNIFLSEFFFVRNNF